MDIINRVYILMFDLLQVGIVMNLVLDFKFHFRKFRLMFFIIITALLFGLTSYIRSDILYNNTNLILCFVFFLIFAKKNKKSRIFNTFLVYAVVSAIVVFVYSTIRNIKILGDGNIELWASVLGTVIIFIAAQVYRKLARRDLINADKGIMILSCSMIFLGIMTAMFPILIADENLKNSKFSIIFSLMSFSVMLGSALLIYFSKVNDEYQLQKKINQEKERLLNDYYNDILKNNTEIRRFRHDYKSHIRSIKYLAKEQKYDQMLQYIQEMDDTVLFHAENIVDVGNEFVSAILSDYMEQSRQAGIAMKVSGVIPEQAQVADIDWSIILSNCMNNAIEATIKVENDNRKIDVHFSSLANKLFIEICNPVAEFPTVCDGKMKTTKLDLISHGFGIKNIKASIEKYHGNLSYDLINDNKIKTKIIMIFDRSSLKITVHPY